MAEQKGNGHDPATERMVEVLERIEKGMGGLREETRAVRDEVRAVRDELHAFRDETRDEILDLHAEVHELRMEIKTTIEARLTRLEDAVFRPTGT